MVEKNKINKTSLEWQQELEAEQYMIMREEGTELPHSSELNHEKRNGAYHCAGCGTKLFSSDAKYESGSGWPSFRNRALEMQIEELREMEKEAKENEVNILREKCSQNKKQYLKLKKQVNSDYRSYW